MKTLVAILGVATAVACHHAQVQPSTSAEPCFSPYPPPPAGTVRLDGPGAFGPHAGDSLIVRVDETMRWSGILQSCSRAAPGLSLDFTRWQAAGDTLAVTSLEQDDRTRRPVVWVLQLATRRK